MSDPTNDSTSVNPSRPVRWREDLRRPFTRPQWAFGLLFWWMSLYPTLLPRSDINQGAISGISIALGMAIGALVAWIVGAVFAALGRTVPVLPGGWGPRLLGGISFLAVLLGLPWWLARQNAQRELVGMDAIGATSILVMVLVSLVVLALLVVIGRSVAWLVRRLDRRITRVVARPIAVAATVVIVTVLGVVITRDVVFQEFVSWANSTYGTFDDSTPEGITQPTSPLRSGGPGSLTPWDTLGSEGRNFAGGGPTVAQLQEFAGPEATVLEPIRVYAGLKSADSVEERARLAVEELERTGAFERSTLMIASVTGTGWVNPVVAAGLEYMNNGDTAIVGLQYSYLPSWISFLVDLDKASDAGRALIDAVQTRWSELPVDDRPRLLTYGESLGSFGAEAAFEGDTVAASVDTATSEMDGVLFMGPTFANPIWSQIVDARMPGAPPWRPEYDGGRQVSIMGWPDQQPVPGQLSSTSRMVYVTHPSDPVTWARVSALWSKPIWMDKPPGYDVPSGTQWFPLVTFVQNVFDLMAGFSATPGYGHNYNPSAANGLAAIAAPAGWSAEDTVRLSELLNASPDS